MPQFRAFAAPVFAAADSRTSTHAFPTAPDDRPPSPAAPAVAIATTVISEPTGYEDFLDRLHSFNAGLLPNLNERVQASPGALPELERAFASVLDWKALSEQLAAMPSDRHTARALIKELCFGVASLNRHYHVDAAAAGRHDGADAVGNFFGKTIGVSIGDMLTKLGRRGQHPPYHSYVTYWLDNPEGLTFTNDGGEKYFHHAVTDTNVRFSRAAELVKNLQTGDLAFDHADAAKVLRQAAEEVRPLHQGYNFRKDVETGDERMSTSFFMPVMRGYLVPVVLAGQKIEGPNATYSVGWPRLDYALDCRSDFYLNAVRRRYQWMVPEHRILLDQSFAMPSLASQLIEQLDIDRKLFDEGDVTHLVEVLGHLPARTREALRAYAGLAEIVSHISGTHLSMIRRYLDDLIKKMTPEELARIVPNPQEGVGGNPIEETERIFAMRHDHPINAKLIIIAKRKLI